jgi:hypothetical protein
LQTIKELDGVVPSQRNVERWIECKELKYLSDAARRLFNAIEEFSTQSEPPDRVIPSSPLASFDNLVYLGSLRNALTTHYRGFPPTRAQAQYIPAIIRHLDQCFFEGEKGALCIVSPPNSGKGGMILTAALAAIAWQRGPAIVMQPHRAQIAESVTSWSNSVALRAVPIDEGQTYRSLTIAGSSALLSDFDRLIVRGKQDIVAIIPEKLAVLSRYSDALESANRSAPLASFCKLLIADELLLLLDPQRGPKLEIMLTLAKYFGIPIIAIGAAVNTHAAKRIANWLADLPESKDPRETGNLLLDRSIPRDPPIEYIVWRKDGAVQRWSEALGEVVTEEEEPLDNHTWIEDVSELVVRELECYSDRQILVFVESRDGVVDVAKAIATRIQGKGAILPGNQSEQQLRAGRELIDRWRGERRLGGVDIPALSEARVGIHRRGVRKTNLERIEQAFREGFLRVLVATTTVEAGINLPVDTVIQTSLLDHRKRRLRQSALEQRLGRSGRTLANRETRAGRGIIYVDDKNQRLDRIIETRILTEDPAEDSQLTGEYRALLILVAMGDQVRSAEDIARVVAHSYWAYDKSRQERVNAAAAAVRLLERYKLIEAFEDYDESDGPTVTISTRREVGWQATPLGKALAAGLLLPRDAAAVEAIVGVAEQLADRDPDEWLAGVLHAGCLVPSIAEADLQPRAADVRLAGAQGLRGLMRGWCVPPKQGDDVWHFGMAKHRKMPAVGALGRALHRIHERQPRSGEDSLVLRTYLSWLWALGQSINLRSFISDISEDVIEQELAYHLSHVIRAAAWFARYSEKFILEVRLADVSAQVNAGVPSEMEYIRTAFQDEIDRARVVKSYETGMTLYDVIISDIPESEREAVRLEIEDRVERRRERRANDANMAVGSDDGIAVELMRDADMACELLRKVWLDESSSPYVEDGSWIWAGPLLIEVCEGDISEVANSQASLLLTTGWLGERLAYSQSKQPISVLGKEEFACLLLHLSRSTAPVEVLRRLADSHMVCRPDWIAAIANQVATDTATGT